MSAVVKKKTNDKPGPVPLHLGGDLKDRIEALVEVINADGTGARANRATVIRDALRGGGLAALERRYGIAPPADEQ